MSNINNEASSGAPDDLSNLPEKDRKETQEILNEIAGGDAGASKPDEKKPDEKPPEAVKPPEATTPPAPAPDGGDKDKKPDQGKEDRRDVSLMPKWVHTKDTLQWKREKDELMAKIEKLSKSPDAPPKDAQPGAPAAPATPDFKAQVAKVAEKHNITAELAEDLVKIAIDNSGKVPADITAKLDKIDRLEADRAIEVETARFSNDFDRLVLPLIKAEYGNDVPTEVVTKIKEDLKGVAYSPDYAKVPYITIYKGADQFRGIIPNAKKGAESSRGGYQASRENSQPDAPSWKDKVGNGETLSDEEISKLSDKEFDEYTSAVEKREHAQK